MYPPSSLTIEIPSPSISYEIELLRARLVYLETPECRTVKTKEEIDAERKVVTEMFKALLSMKI